LITPPVAITSYAACSIAGSDMWKTSIKAFALGIPAYIIPFVFVYNDALLMIGNFSEVAFVVITAFIGVFVLAASVSGYLYKTLVVTERIILIIVSLLFISPSVKGMLIGLLLLLVMFIINYRSYKRIWSDRKNKEPDIING
jgi:TRAP-type uncharacterized transport system fused permease subunit